MLIKNGAQFWDDPLHIGFRLGGQHFSAKLVDAGLCMVRHLYLLLLRTFATLRVAFLLRWLDLEHVRHHFLERERDVRNRLRVGYSLRAFLLIAHLLSSPSLSLSPSNNGPRGIPISSAGGVLRGYG